MRIPRSIARKGVAAFVAGLVMVGGAYAGIGLAPVSTDSPVDGLPVASPEAIKATQALAASAEGGDFPDLSVLAPLGGGNFYVGAAVTSLAPDETKWQKDGCYEQAMPPNQEMMDHLSGWQPTTVPPGWPGKSPNCVYMGGYGVPGPARAATGVDPYAGVNVRTIAISNGGKTVVWQMLDAVAYFNTYRDDLCADCGIIDIRRAIAERTGGRVKFEDVAIGSTHTHGGLDGYGVWGGLPDWYRTQIRDAVIASAADALSKLQPATISIGSVDARTFNNERRDFYYSTADYGAVWLQAKALPSEAPAPATTTTTQGRGKKKDPTTTTTTQAPAPEEPAVIATLVNFAAHPVVLGAQTLLHGDWPATAAKALGRDMGGVGLVFEGGLGNVSPAGDHGPDEYAQAINMGNDFATFIKKDIARGTTLTTNEIKSVAADIEHPVSNWAETGLGLTNMLDREFMPDSEGGAPGGAYQWGKGGLPQDKREKYFTDGGTGPEKACTTAGPTGIRTQVSGFRVGNLTVLTAPGEIFSNISEVVKSKARKGAFDGGQTMVFAQTQDSLGYIIQSFEVDVLGGLPSYAPGPKHGEYEETFMLDRCFGDHVLQTQLGLIGQL